MTPINKQWLDFIFDDLTLQTSDFQHKILKNLSYPMHCVSCWFPTTDAPNDLNQHPKKSQKKLLLWETNFGKHVCFVFWQGTVYNREQPADQLGTSQVRWRNAPPSWFRQLKSCSCSRAANSKFVDSKAANSKLQNAKSEKNRQKLKKKKIYYFYF